jgi:hypothetical protein
LIEQGGKSVHLRPTFTAKRLQLLLRSRILTLKAPPGAIPQLLIKDHSGMKTSAFTLASLIATGCAVPALAQEATTAPQAAQESAPEAAEAPEQTLTIDSSIADLMATHPTAAIVLKHIPGLNEHPAYDQFKGMSLVELQPWSAGAVTDEIIAAITADLDALTA